MKLSELRSAIRKMKGNPSIVVELTPGVPMTLVLQKTPTLEALGSAYGDTKDDIGLHITPDGVISGTDDDLPLSLEEDPDNPDLFEAMTPVTIVDDDDDML